MNRTNHPDEISTLRKRQVKSGKTRLPKKLGKPPKESAPCKFKSNLQGALRFHTSVCLLHSILFVF
ncbi:hypothetical protein DXA74_04665 [Bacteroides sp. OF04-15BH]|nr:hypothetical protein DXA74_04665 [Bacteroides sp. OF04-15BH]